MAGEGLSHVDEQGRARMVDVGAKAETERVAVARGRITMLPATLALVRAGQARRAILTVARLPASGISAPELICHPSS
jgi:cyclic pyranopterin phosphate synthase